jgi:hypothetical protein
MSKRVNSIFISKIMQLNLPKQTPVYDPEETLIDMVGAYKIGKSLMEDPTVEMHSKIKISQFMSWIEMMADRNGIDLNQKGRIKKVKRSELRETTTTCEINLEEAAFYQRVKGLIK